MSLALSQKKLNGSSCFIRLLQSLIPHLEGLENYLMCKGRPPRSAMSESWLILGEIQSPLK